MGRSFIAAFAVLACSAQAALVTSSSSIPAPKVVITFQEFAGLGYNFTNGPTQIGGSVGLDVVLTAEGGQNDGAILGSGYYGLGPNGNWDVPKTYTAVDAAQSEAWLKISFESGLVSAVGGFLNYDRALGVPIIQALDASDNVLESYNLATDAPIVTSGLLNAGAFRGIVRPTSDIAAFRLQGAYLVMDDLTFTQPAAIPEPATSALMMLSLAICWCFKSVACRNN
jgi:hypothetical protein